MAPAHAIRRVPEAMSTFARIRDAALFAEYIRGHLPTLVAFGGKVVFRSVENYPVLGGESWDAVALQEWPSAEDFERWWQSEEYRPWTEIRDRAAQMVIVQCRNDLPK